MKKQSEKQRQTQIRLARKSGIKKAKRNARNKRIKFMQKEMWRKHRQNYYPGGIQLDEPFTPVDIPVQENIDITGEVEELQDDTKISL